jgi:L-amino acid N-acyltransferase YncA
VPPEPAEIDNRRRGVQALGLPYLVAERPGASGPVVAGFAYAGLYRPRSGYRFTVEDSVYVAPDAQGGGIGRALLAALIERTTALGMRQMIAVIGDSGNTASIGLHAALGFQPIGTFRAIGFKHGRWLDSVLMQRPLGPGERTLPDATGGLKLAASR